MTGYRTFFKNVVCVFQYREVDSAVGSDFIIYSVIMKPSRVVAGIKE
jgi:hypothetical protein